MRPAQFVSRIRCLCLVALVAIPLDTLAAIMFFGLSDSAFTWLWAALGAAMPLFFIADPARAFYRRSLRLRKLQRKTLGLMSVSLLNIPLIILFPAAMTWYISGSNDSLDYSSFNPSQGKIIRAAIIDGGQIYANLYPEAFRDTEYGSAEAWLEHLQAERDGAVEASEASMELMDDGKFKLTTHRIDHSACVRLVKDSGRFFLIVPPPVRDARKTDDGKKPYVRDVSVRVNGKRWISVDELPAQDTLREMCADDGEERVESATLEYILEEKLIAPLWPETDWREPIARPPI